jgi:hypothetical protein
MRQVLKQEVIALIQTLGRLEVDDTPPQQIIPFV